MNKQQLANKIWESANKMRSKIEANEYKDYILGFIFYKYLSDNEIAFFLKQGMTNEELKEVTEEDTETVEFTQTHLGYFIAYQDLFSTWLEMGSDFSVTNVREALSAFSRYIKDEKLFGRIFEILDTGLSKLGENASNQTKSIRDLIYIIKDIPTDGKQGYDALGFIYEYLIEKFASNAGKKAGEFYTPHEVSVLMSEIVAYHLRDRKEIKIYDPTSGSGSLLINIGKVAAQYIGDANKIMYYAQELKTNTYNLTRMNLVMRGILASNIKVRNGDTLENDWPYFDESDPVGTYDPLYVDAVVSNPPYSQAWDPTNKENDPRYARFGLAPKTKADYAFLLHDLYHLKPDGIMTIVLPHGVLFRGGEEGEIRKNLVEYNHIDAIIGLPANIFYGTGIPTIIIVLKQQRTNTDILFIDASKGFEKVGKNNKLRSSDIRRITDTYIKRTDVAKYARVVSREEVRNNDYNLNIPRYVDSSETAENWDIYASMFGGIPDDEIEAFSPYWTAFPDLRKDLFKTISPEYSEICTENVKETIQNHENVKAFQNQYHAQFDDFESFLVQELLDNMATLTISQEESRLSADIFRRLTPLTLIDPYEAYQILDNEWQKISEDLEVIQTEGFECVKKVVPNMVIKKKDGREIETQEGWKGYILPFELVQTVHLTSEINELKADENRLAEIAGELEELLDNLTEEEKQSNAVNDSGDKFVFKEIPKLVKELKKNGGEPDFIAKLEKAYKLNEEEKKLKSKVKKESAELQVKTKTIIETLSDEQAVTLLHEKWISALISKLAELPQYVVSAFCAKVQALAEKYKITLADTENEIQQTEKELSAMLDELTANEYDTLGLQEFQKLLGGI